MAKNIWNILTAAIITTLIGCLGYVLSSISEIQKREAAQQALEFTSKDAVQLQQKLTDVMTDIDLRISLVERDVQWVKIIQPATPHPPILEPSPDAQPNVPMPPMPDPPSNTRQSPRYDLRNQSIPPAAEK